MDRKLVKNNFDIDQLSIIKQLLPKNTKILLEYEGAFSKEIIRLFSQKIAEFIKTNSQVYKKFFYVFIELAQNVKEYSDWRTTDQDGKDYGIGALVIGELDDQYILYIGNVVNNKDLEVLKKKCEIINSLDRESLRLFKRQQRNLIPGTNQNAHIGLIMVALTTRKKLDIEIIPIDQHFSFFILKISIQKNFKQSVN